MRRPSEDRDEIRRLIDLGWTNYAIAQAVGRLEVSIKEYRARYLKVNPSAPTSKEAKLKAQAAGRAAIRAAQMAGTLSETPSLPSVSILDRDLDLTDADYRAGLKAMREAGL